MDYYIQNPEALEGQPKRTIADYVEQNGILVPHRFDSLVEARRIKKGIILRSEHPQDYAGVSGLLESPKLSRKHPSYRGVESLDEVKEIFFQDQEKHHNPLYIQYCELLGIAPEEFRAETSFSIWQHITGLNRVISADSSVSGRYHLLSFDFRPNAHAARGYSIWDNGKLETKFSWLIPEDESDAKRLIADYEAVRNLDRFDSQHCPIMEFQTVDEKNYFLQYHRGRDFQPTSFVLDRNVADGEIEVDLVRGATIPQGVDLNTTILREGYMRDLGKEKLPETEDSSLSCQKTAYDRIMFRRRKFQPFYSNNTEWTFNKLSAEHYARDSLFKPEISGVVDERYLLSGTEHEAMIKEARKTGERQSLRFHLVSDGRKAFLSRK